MDWVKEFLQTYIEDEGKLNGAVEDFSKVFPKHAMPKGKYNEVAEELKLTKEQLDAQKASLTELEQKASSVEEYQQKIEALQSKNTEIEESYKGQIAGITKKVSFEKYLMQNNAHKDAVDLLLEKYLDKVELDEQGNVKDADNLLTTIKTERGGLFIESRTESEEKGTGTKAKATDASDSALRRAFGLKD